MNPEHLRNYFRNYPTGGTDPESEMVSPSSVAAAVLVPLIVRDEGLSVLLTRRAEHLHHHPGQICFPGGRIERHDASPVMAAIRETEEEVGLPAERLEVLGALPEYFSRTGFRVLPVVALVHPPFELRLDAFEVAESFEVPFSFLMDPANHLRLDTEYEGRPRRVYSMPWGDCNIWGTTAAILVSLHRYLHSAAPPERDG
ncbi:CoA pyrophosphatase [Pseudazoarcus pumilus]|uniref:CoA pyrophosphatase n=2 Tax=Pseudazoarcus pumilus TaxID=2067960 RepID=A0A2I6S881_9RHOO|nr:CoA pyrophosphatase [Pseudazoarcus pumilus]